MQLQSVYVVSACRTPIGSIEGSLAPLKVTQLGSLCIQAAVERANISPKDVQEVFMGHVVQANCGQAPARQALLGAGLPITVPATTVNKVCASGMKAVMLACQSLACNNRQVMLAGGMESMSNIPFYIPRGKIPLGGFKVTDGLVGDGLTDAFSHIHMGECAEKTAAQLSITRQEQDDYAIMSYRRTADAWKAGVYDPEVVPVTVATKKKTTLVTQDEEFTKADFSRFPNLNPAFVKDGTITAANASTLNDGASAILLMNDEGVKTTGAKALAQILHFADAALEPSDFCMAPAKAIEIVLQANNLTVDDIHLWEINEAFAVAALANIKLLSLDASKVNVHGGAVSMGHPIGMSGARIVTHLVHALKPGQLGLAAVCNGGGGASALLMKKL